MCAVTRRWIFLHIAQLPHPKRQPTLQGGGYPAILLRKSDVLRTAYGESDREDLEFGAPSLVRNGTVPTRQRRPRGLRRRPRSCRICKLNQIFMTGFAAR